MRIVKCIAPLNITVTCPGHGPSVTVGLGWQGDLDQVLGVTDRGPFTLADGLGDHYSPANFELVAREKKPQPKAPQGQE